MDISFFRDWSNWSYHLRPDFKGSGGSLFPEADDLLGFLKEEVGEISYYAVYVHVGAG